MALSLNEIANKFSTDKGSNHHNYCVIYEKYFEPLRDKPILLIEGGVGGYSYHNRGGESLRTWCEYFKHGRIVTFDIYDKSGIKIPNNGRVFKGSEDDGTFLNALVDQVGAPDIVINDASHFSPQGIACFDFLFARLKSGGIYVHEDIHTAYWGKDYAGTTDRFAHERSSTMNYFKWLCDCVNLGERPDILSIHFYKQLVFITKK